MTDPPVSIDRPKRLVTLRRDGDDFVVLFYPEDIVVFRHTDPQALRKMCAFLKWKIISDSTASNDTGGTITTSGRVPARNARTYV